MAIYVKQVSLRVLRPRKTESFVAMLERGETLHGWTPKPNFAWRESSLRSDTGAKGRPGFDGGDLDERIMGNLATQA